MFGKNIVSACLFSSHHELLIANHVLNKIVYNADFNNEDYHSGENGNWMTVIVTTKCIGSTDEVDMGSKQNSPSKLYI